MSVVPLPPSELQLSPVGPEATVLRALVAAAFGQRRKMLRSSLATLDLDALLPAAACVATSAPPQSVVGGSRQQRRQRRRLGKAGAVSLCDAAGIDAGKRDEAVSVDGFIKLVQTLIKTKTFHGAID